MMTLEDELFSGAIPEEDKLLNYGFQKKKDQYEYETMIENQEFQVKIIITKNGTVKGNIIEVDTQEEFINFRINQNEGTFSNKIKEEFMEILNNIKKHCFRFTPNVTTWVVPANTTRYDVIDHFKKYDTITWRQTTDIKLHDIVYIYIGSPIKAIMFQCEAIKVNFQGEHQNTMELKRLETYEETKYPLEKLQKFDLKAIRGTRKIPEKTQELLNEEKRNNDGTRKHN